jgi:hypothetical protein
MRSLLRLGAKQSLRIALDLTTDKENGISLSVIPQTYLAAVAVPTRFCMLDLHIETQQLAGLSYDDRNTTVVCEFSAHEL